MLGKLPIPARLRQPLARFPVTRRLVANPLVDPDWYRATYADVQATGFDPASHYRLHGWREGRKPNPLFDTAWYLDRYPDVRESGQDPLDHYLLFGGLESRDPSRHFDSAWYLEQYADVRSSGMNPLLHYLTFGHRESRLPRSIVDLDQPDVGPGLRGSGPLLRWLGRLVRRSPSTRYDGRALIRRPVLDSAERQAIASLLNSGALDAGTVVAVAWAGDEDLADVTRVHARRYPATSQAQIPVLMSDTGAIAHLEWLRHNGVTHLVIPEDAGRWLVERPGMRRHLERFSRMTGTDEIAVLDVRRARSGFDQSPAERVSGLVSEVRDRELRDPAILDLWSGFDFKSAAPGTQVFLPPVANRPPFPYLDASVDFVGVAAQDEAAHVEAQRIATRAVIRAGPDETGRSWSVEVEPVRAPSALSYPSVSIVIPTHNGADLVERCLASLAETVPPEIHAEIVVVDDGSAEPTREALAKIAEARDVKLIRSEANLGFVGAINLGVEGAGGDILVLLNDDTVTLPGWLTALLRTFRQRPDAGAVGGKLVYPDGQLQEAGGLIFADGSGANVGRGADDPDAPQFDYVHEVDYVSGALLATPADLFRALGGLDPVYGFGYYDDSDYAFKVRRSGLKVYFQPETVIVHVEGGTAGSDLSAGPKRQQVINQGVFRQRWADELLRQPQRPENPTVGVIAAIADRAARPPSGDA